VTEIKQRTFSMCDRKSSLFVKYGEKVKTDSHKYFGCFRENVPEKVC
jgi:hypothetical protein